MDDDLRLLAELQHHVFSTADAHQFGYDHRAIRAAVDRRRWIRIRRGFYVIADVWATATAEEQHLFVARAVIRSQGPGVALSHTTGALALDVACWKPNLDRIHLTLLDGRTGGVEHGVVRHEGTTDESRCIRLDQDLVVVPAAAAVIGAMMLSSLEQAVVIGDSAARAGLVDEEKLYELAQSLQQTPRTRHVRLATLLVDGRSASPGETLGRMVFWRGSLPRPDLQYEVFGPEGQHAYTDYGWHEERVVGEFDGAVKYQRSWREGETASDVVAREKKREEWIVETDLTMRRMVWADIFTPRATVERFRRALAVGRRHLA